MLVFVLIGLLISTVVVFNLMVAKKNQVAFARANLTAHLATCRMVMPSRVADGDLRGKMLAQAAAHEGAMGQRLEQLVRELDAAQWALDAAISAYNRAWERFPTNLAAIVLGYRRL